MSTIACASIESSSATAHAASRVNEPGKIARRPGTTPLYLRDGESWIADFVDGTGMLVPVATGLRFNCPAQGGGHARTRMVRECAIPLSPDLAARIEALHRQERGTTD
jgi:hypothetical protein